MKEARVLFVDDEPAIRATMQMVFKKEGFNVTVASTVKEALDAIAKQEFDVLLSDLNIGQPGDGFTVVSAMRRSQPKALTLIITGYPDFETALRAIRSQVDDYVTKPADLPKLMATIKEKLTHPPLRRLPNLASKRVHQIIQENKPVIVDMFVKAVEEHSDIAKIPLSKKQRSDHLGIFVDDLAYKLESGNPHSSGRAESGARKHGEDRQQQGYTIPQLVVEARCLQSVISALLQENLLALDISTLVPDILGLGEGLNVLLEASIRAFENRARIAA